MRSSVARPARRVAVLGRDDGHERAAVAAPVRRGDRGLDAVDVGERLGDRVGIAGPHERVEGRQRPGADARGLELLEAGARGSRLAERLRARVAELDREGGGGERASTAVDATRRPSGGAR